MDRSLTKEEVKEKALEQVRYMLKAIEDDLVEVEGCDVSVGVKRTPVDGEVFDFKEPDGHETYTFKVFRMSSQVGIKQHGQ